MFPYIDRFVDSREDAAVPGLLAYEFLADPDSGVGWTTDTSTEKEEESPVRAKMSNLRFLNESEESGLIAERGTSTWTVWPESLSIWDQDCLMKSWRAWSSPPKLHPM